MILIATLCVCFVLLYAMLDLPLQGQILKYFRAKYAHFAWYAFYVGVVPWLFVACVFHFAIGWDWSFSFLFFFDHSELQNQAFITLIASGVAFGMGLANLHRLYFANEQINEIAERRIKILRAADKETFEKAKNELNQRSHALRERENELSKLAARLDQRKEVLDSKEHSVIAAQRTAQSNVMQMGQTAQCLQAQIQTLNDSNRRLKSTVARMYQYKSIARGYRNALIKDGINEKDCADYEKRVKAAYVAKIKKHGIDGVTGKSREKIDIPDFSW